MHRMHLLFIDQELQAALQQASKLSQIRTGKPSFLMREVELNEDTNAVLAIINSSYESEIEKQRAASASPPKVTHHQQDSITPCKHTLSINVNDPSQMTPSQLQTFQDLNAFYSYTPGLIDLNMFRLGPIVRKQGVAIAVSQSKASINGKEMSFAERAQPKYQLIAQIDMPPSKRYAPSSDQVLEGSVHKPMQESAKKR